jgi:TatA/E family protein of Tat protein translocase
MLAGPDLLVILVIALIVFGPKKLPELAKTIGKALGELKKTTEEMKESIGIKDLQEMRSNLTGIDLFTDLAEKVSASMKPKEETEQSQMGDSNTSLASVEGLTPFQGEGKGGASEIGEPKAVGIAGKRGSTQEQVS